MKLYCKYSGLPLAELSKFSFRHLPGKLPFIENWKQAQLIHPVFSLPRHTLLETYHLSHFYLSDSPKAFSSEDRQLWFLAAIHSTQLISQSSPSLPPAQIALRYFSRVCKFLTFLDTSQSPRITSRFPKLHISKDWSWNSFSGWLESIEEAQQDYETKTYNAKQKAKKECLEKQITLKLRKAAIGDTSAGNLNQHLWDYISNELPEHLKNKKILKSGSQLYSRTSYPIGSYTPLSNKKIFCYYVSKESEWKKLFCCSQASINRGDWSKEEIQELEEVILSHTELGSITSHSIISRINQLHQWYHESRNFLDDLDILGVGEKATISAQQKEKQAQEIKSTPEAAMLQAPQRKDYPSEVSYLVASIRWKQAQTLKEKGI